MEYILLKIQIKKIYFAKSNTDKDGFIQVTVSTDAYEFESLNIEINGIFIDEEYFNEKPYPFTMKPNF